MKLLELDLIAFGPFAGVRLDFSRDGALQLIYGPNEAGKSTALRAITNLLFGIPANTADAHRHAMPDLRIGARIAANGSVIQLVRRKGTKNTLLDGDERPLGDDALAPLLGGVGESLFRSVFGLDHVGLRRGAEALLQGRGNVGESLFGAAVGGAGIHALLGELESEASELYKPRGQTPRLNDAIAAFKEAERRSRNAAKSADGYRHQQEALAASRSESAALTERRRRLSEEQGRLERARRVLPLLARRDLSSQLRAALGAIPSLPDDASARRIAAQQELGECGRLRGQLAGEIASIEEQLAELRAPVSLLEINEGVIDDIRDRLGSHRAAASDLPKRRSELRLLEEEARATALRLGRPFATDQTDSLRIPAPLQARIRKLAQERSGFAAKLNHASQELDERRTRLDRLRSQLAALPPASDLDALRAAIAGAQRLGRADDEIDTAAARLEKLSHEVAAGLATLAPWDGDASALRALALPQLEAVDHYAARFEALERSAEAMAERRRECRERAAEIERELEELRLSGDVPNEEQLGAGRAARDRLWREIRAAIEQGRAVDASRADALERSTREADQIADRLRREANRVARQAKLLAERTECGARREALDVEERELLLRRRQLDGEWASLWQPAGIAPLPPVAMRGWIARATTAAQLAERFGAEREALAELRARRERHRNEIERTLRELGEVVPAASERLDAAIDRAELVRNRLEEHNGRRREIEANLAAAEGEVHGVERRRHQFRADLERWTEEWAQTVAPLDLRPGATTEEAVAVLDELTQLCSKVDEIRKLRQRITAMETDGTRFAEDVAALAERYAPALAGDSVDECAHRLVRAYHEARGEQQRREKLQELLAQRREELRACEGRSERAAAALAELMRAAGVQSVEDLEAVERKAAEAARLERDLQGVEAQLLDEGEGASIEQLIEETRGVSPDTIRARLGEIEVQIEEANEEVGALRQRIGSLEAGLEQWEAGESAADAAVEAQEHLAAIRGHVRNYLRLRLAALVLRREIERYREQNQGPLLARAGELFPRLTLGRYSGLRVGFDASDEPVLRCVRAGGAEVGVESLSDGARDQLYLALRVASLERHAALNPPMPVVLDDVLIHFDDARATAALAVLAELAKKTQVLFFTHHTRLIELARAALPDEARVEHELHAGY